MINYVLAFVILNYKCFEDTRECIGHILKQQGEYQKEIIVVDNGSLVGNEIKEIDKLPVSLIKLENNIGFAKANNIGCNFAKRNFNPDFICVINADVFLIEDDFIQKIYKTYDNEQFHILGPKILSENKDNKNPFPAYDNVNIIDKKIKYTKRLIRIYRSNILTWLLKKYIKVKSKLVKKRVIDKNGSKREYGVALHGCALVFSRSYVDKYKNVFFPNTFLYHEEEFLFYRSKRDSLITIYNPEMIIYHKDGSSLDKEFGGKYREKLLFKNEEILKSLLLLKDVYKKGEAI